MCACVTYMNICVTSINESCHSECVTDMPDNAIFQI